MTISLALMFYSNYLLCAALLGGMVLVHLVFHLKSFTKTDWVKAVSAAILFAVLTLPYAIAHRAWVRPDIPRETQSSYLADSAIRFYHNLRELDLIGYVPGFFLLAALVLIIALRKRISLLGAMGEYGVLILGYVLTLSAIPMQAVQWMGWRGGLADIRFLIVILPFSACLCATLLSVVHRLRFGALLAGLAASVLLCTNLLSFRVADQRVRWLLPGYIYEIHAHFDTPYDAAVKFLESNASTDDIVYSIPEYTLPVLQWYLGDRLRMQGLLRPDTSLPRDRLNNLAASLFITDTFPQWVISFGRQQVTDAALEFFSRRQYDYSCDQARATCLYLDVYCRDMTRPELPWHNFGPVSQVGPAEGIYVFGRHQ
jgi:hypothetical protein